MSPSLHPVTYNSNMYFPTQNSVLYPVYVGEYYSNEPAPKFNAGEYPYAEPAIKNYIGNSYFDGTTANNCARKYELIDRAIQNYREYHTMRNGKEEYLDEVLRNAPQNKMKSPSTVESALATDPVQKSYLRSLKRKKLKSFMVRDLIDLPAEENSPDTWDANSRNLSPSAPLTPPPETENPWKNTFVSYLMNKYEPLYSDTAKSHITAEPTYKNHDCAPSDRTPSPLESLADISSTDSPCGKAKRVRTIFTCSQLERFEREFERTHYMVGSERSQLASELNLSESQVKVWFQNRRIKQRKQFYERQQVMLSKLKESQKMDSTVESEKGASTDSSLTSTCSEESSD